MRRALLIVLSALALVATGVVGAIAVGGTGTVDPPPRIAFLANGVVPADALAAGGIAGQLGAPLFTTPATSLNDDARDGIVAYDPDLVIALGGPVAIDDAVLTALSAATGLAITTTEAPTDGIVRVAGGDRFATARAVAGLLAAYDPAYLPVDATALGALDADQVDGMDSTDFAASDQSCDPGEVVTEIDASGNIVCAIDQDQIDGGDAATLDGLAAPELRFPTSVPEGTVLTGFFGYEGDAAFDYAVFGDSVSYGAPLLDLVDAHFVTDPGSPPTQCDGTVDEPTAAPGTICFYPSHTENSDFPWYWAATVHGGMLYFEAPTTGHSHNIGTWALTAPGEPSMPRSTAVRTDPHG